MQHHRRIMRVHRGRKLASSWLVEGATHNERVVSLHSLLDADFYREGACHPRRAGILSAAHAPPHAGPVARACDS
jgi:hypothetical protein